MTRLLLSGVLALALTSGLAPLAKACDHCTYQKVVCYEPVVCYETRTVPYTRCVTEYDECGRAYTVQKTCYRSVTVAVKKVKAVVKYVKVCD
jgi:hypothetical protein